MDCKNHPGVVAAGRCAGCAEAFCGNCLVEVLGQWYCGACKTMAVPNATLNYEAGTIPCKEADEALKYAIIAIFCFGPILGPMAIVKASKAKKMIDLNPRLTGSGKVTAAYIVATIAIVWWLFAVFSQISHVNR
jgi:hypothetical protein